MHAITLFPISSVAHMVQPDEFHDLDIHSPAIEFFTDFKKHRPLTIEGSTLAVDVEMLMRKAHVRIKLVIDADNEFIGTISTEDLSEQNFMIRIANGERLDEITVSDMMCTKQSLLALDLGQLERSSINDIIETLKRSGQQHCLVVDQSRDHIRGIISASDVARRLHVPIRIERVPTFVEIFRSIHRHAM
jgi:DeoR family transcriptional regulator, catabolite repression regulator